jgi:hypothetical protein
MRKFLMVAASVLVPGFAFAQSKPNQVAFSLAVNEPFLQCLAADGSTPPVANVKVKRGNLADHLRISVTGLKPNLSFDLFTVQRSSLDANGAAVPNFPGFGLAWYQTDLQADGNGNASAELTTILLDQIFGFDGDVLSDGSMLLPPTNTFHVGFWFNMPSDAAPCGFNVDKPTPFNGEHMAGPLAMISLPDKTTGLGPLCTSPSSDSPGATCNP